MELINKNNTISELEHLIAEASSIYYAGGDSKVDDAVFDGWIFDLTSLDPENPILKKVGFGYRLEKNAYPHIYGQIYGIDDKRKGFDVDYTEECIISPKLDGGSAISYYTNGKLDRILTRGTGSEGIDITENLVNVPRNLTVPFTGYIRGEIVMTFENFIANFNSDRSLRNTAVGLAKAEKPDRKLLHLLDVIPYIVFDKSLGFLTLDKQESITKAFKKHLNWKVGIPQRGDLDELCKDYLCDGLVCQTKSGHVFAIKYNENLKNSIITGISWRTTGTGILFPRIHYSTVRISNADCTNSSGGSYDNVKRHGYGIGAEIELVRSGEVIPYIIRAISRSDVGIQPKCSFGCPDSFVKIEGAHAFCTNQNCPAKSDSTFKRLINLFAPKFFSSEMQDFLVLYFGTFESYLASKRRDQLKPLIEVIEKGAFPLTEFQKKLIVETLRNFDSATEISMASLVYVAEIKGFGDSYAEKLLDTSDNIEEIVRCPDLPDLIKVDARRSWKERHSVILQFLTCFKISKKEEKAVRIVEEKTACVSGTLLYGTKSSFDIELNSRGYTQVDSVSKDLDLLITNKASSSKKNKAEKLGIKIMTEAEFLLTEKTK